MPHLLQERSSGGFSFDNCARNALIEKNFDKLPKAVKTGTTICGVVFKDGVVLGADTRATEGNIVAEKNCSKIHYIAKNIYCCGAGTAADTEKTTEMIASKVELLRLWTRRTPRGHIGAALVLGGVDYSGPHLYTVAPHGSSDKLPYVTMGSGSLAAMTVLEGQYKNDMTVSLRDPEKSPQEKSPQESEATKLVSDAIAAGIFNDLGSGSNVDICVITKKGSEHKRPYIIANEKGVRDARYTPAVGSTAIKSQTSHKIEYDIVSTRVIRDVVPESEAMDMS